MKVEGHGQGAIISDLDYVKIRNQFRSQKYQLLLDIARYTGERWGAIVQLSVNDVYDADWHPRSHITFKAATTKADTKGKHRTHQVPTHPLLHEKLAAYRHHSCSGWLFPSRLDETRHITLRAADLLLRNAIAQAGLTHKGYCTHSTRRTFITRLWEKGTDIHTIQLITGHKDIKSLVRYIEADPQRVTRAIANL